LCWNPIRCSVMFRAALLNCIASPRANRCMAAIGDMASQLLALVIIICIIRACLIMRLFCLASSPARRIYRYVDRQLVTGGRRQAAAGQRPPCLLQGWMGLLFPCR
jgi:hypothetical protein